MTFQPEVVSRFIEIVEGTAIFTVQIDSNLGVVIPDDLESKYSYVVGSGWLSCIGNMPENDLQVLKDNNGDGQIEDAFQDLFNAPVEFISNALKDVFNLPNELGQLNEKLLDRPVPDQTISLETKLDYIYQSFLPMLKERLKQDVVVTHIAGLIELGEVSTRLLIAKDLASLTTELSTQGFSATYFSNMSFNEDVGETVPRTDSVIDFAWIKAPPEKRNLPVSDSFSVRWESYIAVPTNGDYTLIVAVDGEDESFKLFLDGEPILGKEPGDEKTSFEILITLEAAKFHRIVLEYVEVSGSAGIKLRWKTATFAPEIIPSTVAYPAQFMDGFAQLAKISHRAAK
ncbi:MAG: hypothetical protein GY814_17275, partial [Gammaproteobacteria bacterium]|nr:hypothetical protein [Gammaproteobacteria bacterium]